MIEKKNEKHTIVWREGYMSEFGEDSFDEKRKDDGEEK